LKTAGANHVTVYEKVRGIIYIYIYIYIYISLFHMKQPNILLLLTVITVQQ